MISRSNADPASKAQGLFQSPLHTSHAIPKAIFKSIEGVSIRVQATANHHCQRLCKRFNKSRWVSIPENQRSAVKFALSIFTASRFLSIVVRILPPNIPTSLLLDAAMMGILLVAFTT